ncbi:MAG: glycosyltransferase family 2 protein [Puniceicoccales bacterium]|nr:glycosyltransferase family 2 protein [Puniceicoccales bacterium]
MHEPKISILIPVYNGESTLSVAMDSAINQTLRDIEIICVDDKSTDRSLEILKKYAAADGRIRVLENDKNLGTLAVRIGALLASRGSYVLWLDCDDELMVTIGEKALAVAEHSGADVVLFPLEKKTVGKALESPVYWMLRLKPFQGTRDGGELIQLLAEGKITWNLWNKLWDGNMCRAAAAQMAPFAEGRRIVVGDDLILFWTAAKRARSYALCPTVGYRYYAGGESFSAKLDPIVFSRLYVGNISAIAKKIFSEELDPAAQLKFELVLRRGEDDLFGHIVSMPLRDGASAFYSYLRAFPPRQRGAILGAMWRKHGDWCHSALALASQSQSAE